MRIRDYIIRIYRYEKDRPYKLVGMVEEVGADEKKAFADYDELWRILNRQKAGKEGRGAGSVETDEDFQGGAG